MEILKQTRLGYGLIGLALLSLGSCKKDGVASLNQDSQITFSVKADLLATTNAISGLSTPAGTTTSPAITWTDAIANVSKFKFEAKKGNVKKEIETSGLTNINLFAIDPAAVKSVIDTGTYKEIELKLMLTKSTTSAIPLALKGTFTAADGTLTPIEINVNEDLIVKVEVENIKIDPSTDLKATFVLGLNKILQGITIADLSAATKTGGKIVISSTSNTALLNKVKLNLQNITGAKVESKHKNGNDDGPGHS
ncbi:hypothetical protein DHW03_16340 [Pedobacter yonginense]|uniref:DUF4382 domain-containing protein n=1 Tax=Pedobacter yonginense TaxID=651869 RepID=A0A317EJS8_9SPHI|nr:hypothetical protein [Pedobacter yonginense]PWS26349.1 hypothetical protein DHW03_16340 [Pedobacter yonginense]